jgi:DNA processing protein
MIDDRAYLVALTRFPKFGPVKLGQLMRRFPTCKHIFEASALDMIEAGIDSELVNRFLQERMHLDPEKEWAMLLRHGIEVVTKKDDNYPALLKEIHDPPALLYYRGTLPDSNKKHIAVVGSRKATSYGLKVCESLTRTLAQHGTVIVSGLAYGIDATAHQTTIGAGGTTLAVLGSGIDEESIYPARHRELVSRIIASGGAVLSEFPIGTPPLKQHFPFRNRVIAGICHGTLVVEAAMKSGSLITARSALDSNRDVYAVPGSIHEPLCEGPNELIKQGASAVTVAADILGYEAVSAAPIEKSNYKPTTDAEQSIFSTLTQAPIHVDELVRATKLAPSAVSGTLTLMELQGGARHEGGSYYTKN